MEKEFTQEERDALFAYWTDVENEMLIWAEENGAEDYHKGKPFLSCRYLPNILHKDPEDFKAALQLSLAWTNGWIKASQEG